MATNIPPHNLGEVIDACIAHLDNPEITLEELCQIVQGPDFPTGAMILGRAGIAAAYHKGRGSIVLRAKVHTEEIRKDREALIVTAIPYQVNKRTLIEKIAEQVREKKIEGIADIWDETNREGMRIVIELKRDAIADVVLNQLWRHSDLQTNFGANMLAINGGRPEQLNLERHDRRLHGLPRGGGEPAHQAPARPSRATAPTCWWAWPWRSPTSTT